MLQISFFLNLLMLFCFAWLEFNWMEPFQNKINKNVNRVLGGSIILHGSSISRKGLRVKKLKFSTTQFELIINNFIISVPFQVFVRRESRLVFFFVESSEFRLIPTASSKKTSPNQPVKPGNKLKRLSLVFNKYFKNGTFKISHFSVSTSEITHTIVVKDFFCENGQFTGIFPLSPENQLSGIFKGRIGDKKLVLDLTNWTLGNNRIFIESSRIFLKSTGSNNFIAHISAQSGFIADHYVYHKKVEFDIIKLSTCFEFVNRSIVFDDPSVLIYNKLKILFFICYDFDPAGLGKIRLYVDSLNLRQLRESAPFEIAKHFLKTEISGSVNSLDLIFIFRKNNPRKHFIKVDISQNLVLVGSNKYFSFDKKISDYLNIDENPGRFPSKGKTREHLQLTSFPFLMRESVLVTEDPQFYKHSGVDVNLLGFALATNIKERKVVRGASTITMQLIRNLFLGHNRNLLQKTEEIVLSLFVENVLKIKKDRILEIYLNIIEMAPDLYGIQNGSKFYFEKGVEELSYEECLVLTYVIPRPKHFLAALQDESAQLRRNLKSHLIWGASVLHQKGFISHHELQSMDFIIRIRGKRLDLNMT